MELKRLIYGIAFLVLIGVILINKSRPTTLAAVDTEPEGGEFSYSIPRIKSFHLPFQFSLKGRSLVHIEEKNPSSMVPAPLATATPLAKPKDDKKVAKKTEVAPSPSVANNDPTPLTTPVAHNDISGTDSDNDGNNPTFTGTTSKAPTKAEEWKNRLIKNPTRKLMLAFVEAFKKLEVTSDEFHNILADLLENSRKECREVALFGLAASPSVASFTQLVAAEKLLPESERSEVSVFIKSYETLGNIATLKLALNSTIPEVLTKATDSLVEAIAKIIQSLYAKGEVTAANSHRDRRGQPVEVSGAEYNKVMAVLIDLTTSKESRVALAAEQAIASTHVNRGNQLIGSTN